MTMKVFWVSPQSLFCQVRGAFSEEGRGRTGAKNDSYNPQLTGVAAVTVSIRAYNATGELDIRRSFHSGHKSSSDL